MATDPEEFGAIYRHAGGDHYVLIARCQMKHPDTGEWLGAVVYAPERTPMEWCTTKISRWRERFTLAKDFPCETDD